MQVIEYDEWIEQTDRQVAQQIALLTAQSGVDGIVDLDNVAAFPAVGVEGYLYLAKDTGKLYSWNADEKEYIRVDAGSDYVLPVAASDTLGGVKVGGGLSAGVDGTLSVTFPAEYVLPVAASDTLGGVKVGGGLSIDEGVLSADAYELPVATGEVLGGVMVGNGLTITGGVLSANGYTLPTATKTVLGGVISGDNASVDGAGNLSVYIQKEKVRVVEEESTITDDDNVIIGNVSDAELDPYQVSLPSAQIVGRIIKIKNVGTSSMSITPDGFEDVSDTIDGDDSPVVLAQFDALTLLCYDTGEWCKL